MATSHVTERILCPICRAANRSDARFCQQCGNDVLLDATYRITRVIKEGGMGVVYQAVDDDGAFYAIKEMHDRFTDAKEREEGIQRFIDEAKLLRSLRGHPAIPNVYRSFIDEGRYYLSMEFIFGEDLEDMLKRQKRFPEPQVLRWADQLCDVLEYLHAHGLIYRDMKPSNIMITREGNVKVVDFGIAKLLQPGQRGTMIGTPGYAPPEQYQGIATPQSDVYALASPLHHLLTGRDPREEPPFSFPPARSIQPDISTATSDALEQALQMEVEDRFRAVEQFRRALPIPTGDRQPTRIFDPQPPIRPQPQPANRTPPANRAQPVNRTPLAPQPRAVPQRPLRQPQPRRSNGFGRTVRRIVAAGFVFTGLYFGGLAYRPDIVVPIRDAVVTTIERVVRNNTAPTNGNNGTITGSKYVQTDVQIEVVNGASEAIIRQKLLDQYLAKAQEQYPDAQLIQDRLPDTSQRNETSLGNGSVRITATVKGYIATNQ